MAIAIIRVWIALDESVWRHRHRARIGLSLVGNDPDWRHWLRRCVYYLISNAKFTAVVEACPEIRMQRRASSSKRDDIIRVRIDRHRRDVCVPGVVGRKWDEPI